MLLKNLDADISQFNNTALKLCTECFTSLGLYITELF